VVIGGVTYQVAPDLSARGSERVIIGGGEKIYYTPDHYAHFILLTVVY
jgi:guanyl-specific ribonuclease Sa